MTENNSFSINESEHTPTNRVRKPHKAEPAKPQCNLPTHKLSDLLSIAITAGEDHSSSLKSESSRYDQATGYNPDIGYDSDSDDLPPAPSDPHDMSNITCSLSQQAQNGRPVTRSQTAKEKHKTGGDEGKDGIPEADENDEEDNQPNKGQKPPDKDLPEDKDPSPSQAVKGNRRPQPFEDRQARQLALQQSTKHLYGFDLKVLEGNHKLNVISLNVAGATLAKESPQEFVADLLALLDRMHAQVICLQDYNLVKGSYADSVVCMLLGQVGLTMCSSIRDATHSRLSASRNLGLGVASSLHRSSHLSSL